MFNKKENNPVTNGTNMNSYNNGSHNNNNNDHRTESNHSSSKQGLMNRISERSEIIGTLKSRRDIHVAGKVDGGVEAEGKVIIAESGFVDGSVNAKDAQIDGRVKGDVHASNKLTLGETAVVESDIYAKILAIEEGAIFNGSCHMEKDTTEEISDDAESMWNSNNEEEESVRISDEDGDYEEADEITDEAEETIAV